MQFCSHGSSNNSTTPLSQGLSSGYTLLPEAKSMCFISNGVPEKHFANVIFSLLLALLTMKSNSSMAVRFFLQVFLAQTFFFCVEADSFYPLVFSRTYYNHLPKRSKKNYPLQCGSLHYLLFHLTEVVKMYLIVQSWPDSTGTEFS